MSRPSLSLSLLPPTNSNMAAIINDLTSAADDAQLDASGGGNANAKANKRPAGSTSHLAHVTLALKCSDLPRLYPNIQVRTF